jgi:hypothetical protein
MLVEQTQMGGLTGTVDAFERDKKIHEPSKIERKRKTRRRRTRQTLTQDREVEQGVPPTALPLGWN